MAESLGTQLVDASCGGAGTDNLTIGQDRGDGSTAAPQIDAVGPSTDLVTIGLGFNDFGWFVDLLFGCTEYAAGDPGGHPCHDHYAASVDWPDVAGQIGQRVQAGLTAVHARAPSAELLVVGYPQLVPASGTCPELPLAAGDYPWVHHLLRLLDESLRQAAEDADASFIDVYAASRGHDICAGPDAWVNGRTNAPGVAASYHPFAAEQQAVTALVVARLKAALEG